MDELETYSRLALIAKGREMGLRNFRGLKKKELIEIIRNPPPPKTPARYAGVRKKVTLTPIQVSPDNDQSIETLVFPTIYKASKHFNINPARFGSKNDESEIVIKGIRYSLSFESYTLKKDLAQC